MVRLFLNKGLQFTAEDDRGHTIVVDTRKDVGGFNEGFHPIQLLLVSLAACMGMDMVSILKKKGGKIDAFEITVDGTQASEHPKRYEKITMTFRCTGDYRREDLLRAHELSRDKYCPAYATLQHAPEIESIV
jgi:putative redox protein